MNLLLLRDKSSEFSTIGELFLDKQHFCWTLEDVVRDIKIPGETAIPAGIYEIELTFSHRFQRILPLLMNVPDYEGVRIHPGNRALDTEGCILVGLSKSRDFISSSNVAFAKLYLRIQGAINKGNGVVIEIRSKQS